MPRLPHRVDARGIPVSSQQWVEHAGTPRSRHRERALPIQFHATAVTREINANMSKTPKIIYTLTDEAPALARSEEHTSELQSRPHLVCRLLLEKKKKKRQKKIHTKQKNI